MSLKTLEKVFKNLFRRAYFRCTDESWTCSILMCFRNLIHDRWCFFFFYNLKTQTFSIFCVSSNHSLLILTFFSLTLYISFMPITPISFNTTSPKYCSHIVTTLLNLLSIRTITNFFMECLKEACDVNFSYNRIGLKHLALIQVLSVEPFFLNYCWNCRVPRY